MLKYTAAFVFWTAVSLSLLSLWLLPARQTYSWVLAGLAAAFNVWSLYQSDHGGFVRSRHAPRSQEPPRHFTPLQILVVFVLLLAQLGLTTYLIVEQTHSLENIVS